MPGAIVVRYRTAPERREENKGLVQAVFAGLARAEPAGLRYAALRLDGGAEFLHLALLEEGEPNPLVALPAFQAFQSGIAERCDEQPTAAAATVVGAYRMWG